MPTPPGRLNAVTPNTLRLRIADIIMNGGWRDEQDLLNKLRLPVAGSDEPEPLYIRQYGNVYGPYITAEVTNMDKGHIWVRLWGDYGSPFYFEIKVSSRY